MNTPNKQSRERRIIAAIGSRRFFWVILGLFVFESLWIALTGRYPMAFDEDFHLGIIRLYAHHLSPFWNGQPADANAYGPVARDPSYLYQYLMSFPYRLISLFTRDQTLQVLWLRFINVGLFAAALPLYQRLLRRVRASAALANGCLLLFVLVPIAPFLAAQINYDNLLLPLTALSLLTTLRVSDELRSKQVGVAGVIGLLVLCLLTSLVKYAFLPIFFAIVLFLGIRVWKSELSWRNIGRQLRNGWQRLSTKRRCLLAMFLIVSLGLFGQRYVVNIVRYHEPIPDCSQVLSVKACSAYGPWTRDYNYKMAKASSPHSHSPLIFSADWFYGMWLRSFFAVDGPRTDFQTRGPLPVPSIAGIVLPAVGLLLVIRFARRFFHEKTTAGIGLIVLSSLCYMVALWLDEYRSFISTKQPVAINGRYLLPIFPLLLFVFAKGFTYALNSSRLRLGVLAVSILCLLWGGGALTYILRSSDVWYWPSQPVYDINHTVKHVLGPVTPGYDDPTEFMH